MIKDFIFDKKGIYDYHSLVMKDEFNRYRSWEHCYCEFGNFKNNNDHLALHLAFYLASWGMYRGSSFLLQKDYKIHTNGVAIIKNYNHLRDFNYKNEEFVFEIITLSHKLREYYKNFCNSNKSVTDTLISKILLGTLGCSPAFDRYFNIGASSNGFRFTKISIASYIALLEFCEHYSTELKIVQLELQKESGIFYPILKLVDMYFWQEGFIKENSKITPIVTP